MTTQEYLARRKFPLIAVMAIATNYLMGSIADMNDCVSCLVQKSLCGHEVPKFLSACRAHLQQTHPELCSPEVFAALEKDQADMETVEGDDAKLAICRATWKQFEAQFGAIVTIEPIPPELLTSLPNLEELRTTEALEEEFGADRLILGEELVALLDDNAPEA